MKLIPCAIQSSWHTYFGSQQDVPLILKKRFKQVIETIIQVWRTEQDHENNSPYRFERSDCRQSDTLIREGKGGVLFRPE